MYFSFMEKGPEMAPASIAELEAVGAGEAALLTADVAEGATAAAGAAEEGAAAAATGEGASAGVAGEGASAGSTTAVTGSGEVGATVGTTEGATTTGESVVTVGRSDVNIAAKGEDGSGAAGEFCATADEAGFNSGKIACSRLRRRTLPFAGCGQSLGIYRFDQPQHVLAPGESFLRTAPVDVSPTGASQPLYEQLTAAEETINNVAARRTRSAELQLIARQRSALTNDFSSGSNQVYQDFRFNPVSGDAASAYIPHSEPGEFEI